MISTRGRYALRVMADLAGQDPEAWVPLSEIAQRQDISMKYLELILRDLVAAGLLSGRRGKGGGYRLNRAPEDINAWEILSLTETNLCAVACLQDGAPPCPRADACPTLPIWRDFNRLAKDYFSGVTLERIAGEGRQEAGSRD